MTWAKAATAKWWEICEAIKEREVIETMQKEIVRFLVYIGVVATAALIQLPAWIALAR